MASPIMQTYLARTRSSAEAHRRAKKVLPGGNTRQTAFWKPYPICIERANSHELVDVDGNRYVDLNNNYTALVHGHAYPPVVRAVQEQIGRGSCWAAGAVSQASLAERIVDRVASVEQVRFTNSGTEAANLAFSIARAVTGRDRVLMARHGYHGSLVGFESGHTNRPWPMTRLANYNDAEGFDRILRDKGSEIAAVFLEPALRGPVARPPYAPRDRPAHVPVSPGGPEPRVVHGAPVFDRPVHRDDGGHHLGNGGQNEGGDARRCE